MRKTEIFNQDELEFVSNLIDSHNDILMENEEYRKINDKISKIVAQANELPDNLKNMFYNHRFLLIQSCIYEYSLLYHLGLKKGFELKEIK